MDTTYAADIIRARPDQAPQLTDIAHAAKRHWGYPERWIGRWRQDLTVTPGFIARECVFLAQAAGGIAGFYALAAAGLRDAMSVEHLWVDPAFMGRGIGRALFGHAVRQAIGRNVALLQIESDPHAEGFYRHMGARTVGHAVRLFDGRQRALPLLFLDTAPAGAGVANHVRP